MTSAKLTIGHLAVAIADESSAADVEETVRKSLALLASRLSATPLASSEHGLRRALELIELEPLPAEWLSTPQAAARIADELYRRILDGGS